MFSGSLVAIVTPFTEKGEIDVQAFTELIEFQITNGTDGIVPCGTTGESATLSHQEHDQVVELTVKIVNGRVPVIAGSGSNSTSEALRLTKKAKDAGADGALLITPYYNKPPQEGLYQHYKKIAGEVDGFPLVLYNVPGRTGVNMLPQTVARLAEIENIVAIKEATGSLTQITEIIALCGNKITVLSGDDFTVLPTLAIGGKGVISVVANVAPADMAGMIDEFNADNLDAAAAIQRNLFPLCQAMFFESNPIPVKTALGLCNRIRPEVRLPLSAMSEANLVKLKNVLTDYGLL